MAELSLFEWLTLSAVTVEVVLFMVARRIPLPPRGYGWLAVLALLMGLPVLGWLGCSAGELVCHAEWTAAAKQVLLFYITGTATWLAWREAKPF